MLPAPDDRHGHVVAHCPTPRSLNRTVTEPSRSKPRRVDRRRRWPAPTRGARPVMITCPASRATPSGPSVLAAQATAAAGSPSAAAPAPVATTSPLALEHAADEPQVEAVERHAASRPTITRADDGEVAIVSDERRSSSPRSASR